MDTSTDIKALNEKIYVESGFIEQLYAETNKIIVGQPHMVERLMIGLLTGGHVLLEGLPGLAKTLAIKTLSNAIKSSFSRIQFTPDLLPADIVGTMIYNPQTAEFHVKQGPIFANFILADEINRAPAKVQSALLEAMQEKQVTIGTKTFKLKEPFLVLATQNPIPTKDEERTILRNNLSGQVHQKVNPITDPKKILVARDTVREVYMDEKIEQYILDLVFATRNPEEGGIPSLKPLIDFGGSPRATISLAMASKAYAFIHRRGYVIPDDVRAVCHDVLRHRIGLTYEAEAENVTQEEIISQLLNTVQVP